MARLLAEGTGARWAEVWLVVDGEPELAAAWPQEAGSRTAPGGRRPARSAIARRHARRRAARHPAAPGAPGPAAVAGRGTPVRRPRGPGGSGAPRCAAARRAGAARRGPGTLADDLQASRRRVVDAHDSERRRLERDIHDGAQQHLVALVVNLRLAHTLTSRVARPGASGARRAGRRPSTTRSRAWSTSPAGSIRRCSPRTASPPRCVTSWAPAPSRSRCWTAGSAGRTQELETALYFCCVEAVQNAVKHAAAEPDRGRARPDVGDRLELRVRDDGTRLRRSGRRRGRRPGEPARPGGLGGRRPRGPHERVGWHRRRHLRRPGGLTCGRDTSPGLRRGSAWSWPSSTRRWSRRRTRSSRRSRPASTAGRSSTSRVSAAPSSAPSS